VKNSGFNIAKLEGIGILPVVARGYHALMFRPASLGDVSSCFRLPCHTFIFVLILENNKKKNINYLWALFGVRSVEFRIRWADSSPW
jgi:hypothetical protein